MKTLKSFFLVLCVSFMMTFSGCANKENNLSKQQKMQQSQDIQDMRPTKVNTPGLYVPYNHEVIPTK